MKRAVIYARYSSDKQTEQSIEGQLRVCNDFAKNNEYTIVGVYIDRAVTGTNDNREEFQKMIRDSASKTFDYVLVYKLDRFARNRYDSTMNKATLKRNGVKLISATEPISDQPEGIILESLLEGMAEYYSAELSQKVKRGIKESRLKGFVTGGNKFFGYDLINKKYVINPEQALIIQKIYRDYLNGIRIKEISRELKALGVKGAKGNYLSPARISDILKNPKYKGLYIGSDGVEYKNMLEPIIDAETFDNVQLLRKQLTNKNARGKAPIPYILSGKIYCGHCGSLITGNSGTSKNGKVHYYYKCTNKTNNTKNCKSKTYRKDEFEEFIYKTVFEKINDSDIYNEIVSKTVEIYNKGIQNNSNLSLLKSNLLKTKTKLNNIVDAISQGLYNPTMQEAMNKLSDEANSLEEQIAIEELEQSRTIDESVVKEHLNNFLKYSSSDCENKKFLFDLIIDKIIIYDNDEIVIICNSIDKSLQSKEKTPHEEVFVFNLFGGVEGT